MNNRNSMILLITLFFGVFVIYAIGQELTRKVDHLGGSSFLQRFGCALKASSKWWAAWCVGIFVSHAFKRDYSDTLPTIGVALSLFVLVSLVKAVELPEPKDKLK